MKKQFFKCDLVVIGHPLATHENRLPFFELQQNLNVHLIAPENWKSKSMEKSYFPIPAMKLKNFHYLKTFLPGQNSLFYWISLFPLLKKLKPKLIYCWSEPWTISAAQSCLAAKMLHSGFGFYSAENLPKHLPLPFLFIRKLVYWQSRLAVCISREAKDQIQNSGFPGCIHIIPLWSDAPKLSSPRKDPGVFRVVFVGRLIPLKGIQLVLKSLNFIDNIFLDIIGGGPLEKTLKQEASARKMRSKVRFHGVLNRNEIFKLLPQCNLLILPTQSNSRQAEQFGKAVIEGVMAGIPVLVSESGELKNHGRTFDSVFVKPMTTPEEIAYAIKQIKNRRVSHEKLLFNRNKAIELFGINTASKKFQQAFSPEIHKKPNHFPTGISSNRTQKIIDHAGLLIWRILPKPPRQKSSSVWKNNKKILICKFCCFGDAILMLYSIQALKKLHPDLEIQVFTTPRTGKVFEHCHAISRVWTLPLEDNSIKGFFNPWFWLHCLTLLRNLRNQNFDGLVDMELYQSYPEILKPLLGIPYSRGFLVPKGSSKHHDTLILRKKHYPEWKCGFDLLGLPQTTSPVPIWNPVKPPMKSRTIGLVIGSSSNWQQKRWPLENYLVLIHLLTKKGYSCRLIGSHLELQDMQRLASQISSPLSFIQADGNLTNHMEQIAQCLLVVGNDTGTLHLASACGIPTLTLFGPTDPEKWLPPGGDALFSTDFTCQPCYYLSSMPNCTHLSCLKQLNPGQVAERIVNLTSKIE